MRKHLNLLGATLALATAPAFAVTATPFTPSNFSGWAALGDVTASSTAATLTTAAVGSDELPLSANSALLFSDLEPALGIYFPGDTYEGSAISTSFTAAAGSSVSLNWSFATALLYPFSSDYADRAYVVIDGVQTAFATGNGTAQSGSFSHTFTTGGTHSLAFAVLDVGDSTEVSTLSLSGLAVTPAVPEPASVLMLLAGMGIVGAAARRRRG